MFDFVPVIDSCVGYFVFICCVVVVMLLLVWFGLAWFPPHSIPMFSHFGFPLISASAVS